MTPIAPARHRTRTTAARRRLGALAAAGLCLALTACTAPLPEVTFYANRAAIDTPPTRWCTITVTVTTAEAACVEAATDALPRLTVRPGQPVQINVPGAVGHQPWAVYFRYLDGAGKLQDGRSEIFSDGRLAYTLRPFGEDDQLVYVEVRSGFQLTPGAGGGVDYSSTQGWALLLDPEPTAGQ